MSRFASALVQIVSDNKNTTMKTTEHSIDLRKEKTISEQNEIVAVNPDDGPMHSAIDIQNQLITQTQVPKKLPAMKPGEKQISIIIDMKLVDGDDDFVENLKLNIISQINAVICNATRHTKTQGGYTINRVKLNTEIICR